MLGSRTLTRSVCPTPSPLCFCLQDLEGRKQDGTVFPLRLSVAKGWKNDRRIFVAYMSVRPILLLPFFSCTLAHVVVAPTQDITGEHLQNDLMEQQELLESEKARSEVSPQSWREGVLVLLFFWLLLGDGVLFVLSCLVLFPR